MPDARFRPQAVCFDLDGTIVDSEREIMTIMAVELARRGRPLSDEEQAFVIGHGWSEIYAFIHARGPLPLDLPALEQVVFQARRDKIKSEGIEDLPGAAALVRRLAARLPCALVTGSSRPEAELVLDALGITACFQTLCCAGEYPRGKPAPDPYLLAAERLGVPAAACLALEDSAAGIASARAAGMFCVAVAAGNFARQDQAAANLLLATMEEVDAWLSGI